MNPMDYDVRVTRYRRGKLLCWHGKEHWRLLMSSNGAVAYCGKCGVKKIGLHDFGVAHLNKNNPYFINRS